MPHIKEKLASIMAMYDASFEKKFTLVLNKLVISKYLHAHACSMHVYRVGAHAYRP